MSLADLFDEEERRALAEAQAQIAAELADPAVQAGTRARIAAIEAAPDLPEDPYGDDPDFSEDPDEEDED